MAIDGKQLLEAMLKERGYVLSHHVIFGSLEPTLLAPYADLYRTSTLDQRFLNTRQRELVWLALLTADKLPAGTLHFERAEAAGIPASEQAAAVSLAGVAEAWPSLAFGERAYGRYIQDNAEAMYLRLVDAARGSIEPELADLMLATVHGARKREAPLVLHLRRALDAGWPETHVAEAVGYLLLPVGVNTLLWVTDVWLEALRDGRLPESPTFGRANFKTKVD